MRSKPIYVEIHIDADVEAVWEASQDPFLHSQWDLRFSSITYLPRKEGEPQLFTYERKVLPFLTVQGWGKSSGISNHPDGTRSSALHFGTDQWHSPIKEGKGYWKYEPDGKGTTFLTQYNYDANFRRGGTFIDSILFRPMMGWATAVSFDVLKRWLEKGESPASQYLRFFTLYGLSMFFAFIWIYQGLMPKLVGMHPEERSMIGSTLHLTDAQSAKVVLAIGILEVLFGLLWIVYRRKKHLFALQIVVFPLLTLGALAANPGIAIDPFNPVTFNLALFVLTWLGYINSDRLPSATSCKRKR
ncbi:DoxX-like family protein [Sporosarcina sp. Te-1]|uniref:DoxX-like family protein n=1 Tax=Sporosarcina sp. Te-1 TaxID=2818390 RepID=UPI001A9D31B8|nr:DoxX-like family protein [Sporosarcina sp. Te-1]QTD42605.1 hypothetical protein J3U78_07325 [Sporosarcina sp. Te-1]